MMVKKICDAAGITILEAAAHGDKTGPRETQAVGTMLSLVRKYTEAQLIWTLKIIPEAYGDEKGKLRALSIKAVAKFLRTIRKHSRKGGQMQCALYRKPT